MDQNRQAADGEQDASLVPPTLPEGLGVSLFLRVREIVDLFLQRIALRLKFTYLLLEGRVLRLKLDNLSEGNRQLKLRLLGLRRWHVQYPPVDEADASAVEHEQKAGAEFDAQHKVGRPGGGDGADTGSVTPNV